MTIFIKINTVAVVFTIIITLSIIGIGLVGLYKTKYEYIEYFDNTNH